MKVIVTAGGTGGHVMPAISIAEALRKKLPDTEIVFIGTDRGLEEKVAKAHGLDFYALKAAGIKGKGIKQLFRAATVNIGAFLKALKIVRKFRPDWIIGTGGYVTGMVVLAGRLAGARCAIQEQNTIPGLTNRILSRLSHKIFLAFPDANKIFPKQKVFVTGNPIRTDILNVQIDDQKRDSILIMGGSLGARNINTAAVGAIKISKQKGFDYKVIHLTGSQDMQWVEKEYKDANIHAEVHAFMDDMASLYTQACLIICRAGGITLSELSHMKVPAIMIPLPHAADDHQRKNAEYVASHGGGWIILEKDLTPDRLAQEIKLRINDREGLKIASLDIGEIFLGDAADMIAEEIIRV